MTAALDTVPASLLRGNPAQGSTLVARREPILTGGGPARATEASLLPRFVALLTPVFAVLAGALASWVAKRTGAHLDSAGLTTFMLAAVTSVLGSSWKWLQGWQQHELLVAQGRDVPRRPGTPVGG